MAERGGGVSQGGSDETRIAGLHAGGGHADGLARPGPGGRYG